MNWFRKHPNWTTIIFTPVIWALPWLVGEGASWGGLYPGDDLVDNLAWFIIPIGTIALYAWNLSVKGRTGWWLGLLLLGIFGLVAILALGNRRETETERASPRVVAKATNYCPHCGRRLPSGVRNFCPACGKSLVTAESASDVVMKRRIEDEKMEIITMIDGALRHKGGQD